MKNEMKKSLERRFAGAEGYEKLLIATFLYPTCRFKEKFFTGPLVIERAKSLLQEKLDSMVDNENCDHGLEPPPKRPCTDLWKGFSDVLEEAGAGVSDEGGSKEFDVYLAEPLISFDKENCYNWWANNRQRLP